jgi:hypothetical protein
MAKTDEIDRTAKKISRLRDLIETIDEQRTLAVYRGHLLGMDREWLGELSDYPEKRLDQILRFSEPGDLDDYVEEATWVLLIRPS